MWMVYLYSGIMITALATIVAILAVSVYRNDD